MGAREIVKALGGRWHGNYGMARCPVHDDREPSLKVRDHQSKHDALDLHCFAGCDWRSIKDTLIQLGLLQTQRANRDGPLHSISRPAPKGTTRNEKTTTETALAIWRRSKPAAGTDVEEYLLNRSIRLSVPACLRFHPRLRHRPSGLALPAMVAAIQAHDDCIVGIHRTYLNAGGSRKADVVPQKMALGAIGRGAVRLAPTGSVLGLAEGIETALSAMQLFCLPCWAVLGSRLDRVGLPESVKHVVLFADRGKAGEGAAKRAATAFKQDDRRVTIALPDVPFGDWNDQLRGPPL